MKQDNLDQLIKDSLESVQPEVPAHLWDNIRAGIQPASPPADSAVQGGSASSGGAAGSAGLLKIGAAAVALIGGGLLVWQLSTDTPTDENRISSVTNEQKDVRVPETESTAKLPVESNEITSAQEDAQGDFETEIDDEIESNETDEVAAENDISESSGTPEVTESDVVEETSENKDSNAAADQNLTENDMAAQEESAESDDNEVTAENAVAQEENSEEVVSDDIKESIEIAEPFVLVEAGVLADKVSGDVPLKVNFSNITMAKSYEWTFDNGQRSTDSSPEMTFDEPGDYTVRLTVTDFEGNEFSDLIEVSAYEAATLIVPNAFTPNGDGDNDYYYVQGTNISSVKFKVYRLDGSLVFEGNGLNDKWDGSDSQSPMADKYYVVATAIKESGEPIFERILIHALRD